MYISVAVNSVTLHLNLWHGFYNVSLKSDLILQFQGQSPSENFWVDTCLDSCWMILKYVLQT